VFAPTERNARDRKTQKLVRLLFMLMTGLLVLPVLTILGLLVWRGTPALSINFLLTEPTQGMTAGGIFPALIGTVWLVAVALLVSVPIGVAAALYLSEYARATWLMRLINLAIINLAGVPSIVHALFGVGAFVLPNSISGILTGVILEVSRTAGETAPIMFTGAAFFLPFLPQNVFDQTMAMSLHLFVISTQVPGVPEEVPYGVALVLIMMVLAMNALSIAFRMWLRGRKKW
jgi:phosphate transport system permease protein